MNLPYNLPDLSNIDLIYSIFGAIRDHRKLVEKWFNQYTGKPFCVFVDSCKGALFYAYSSMIDKGKVAVSPLTCETSILPIISAGFRPYYVDIDPATLNMDIDCVKKAVKQEIDIKAIQVIHHGGNPCKIDEVAAIARERNLVLIEDCAQSLGASYKRTFTGMQGDIACFSFMKNIHSTGGGIICVNDEKLWKSIVNKKNKIQNNRRLLLVYRWMKLLCDKYYDNSPFFYLNSIIEAVRKNSASAMDRDEKWLKRKLYKPARFDACLTYRKLNNLAEMIKRRRAIATLYNHHFEKCKKVYLQMEEEKGAHIYTKYFIRIEVDCSNVIEHLIKSGVQARHLENRDNNIVQKRIDYKKLLYDPSILKCKNYLHLYNRILSLPISSCLTDREVYFVANKTYDILSLIGEIN